MAKPRTHHLKEYLQSNNYEQKSTKLLQSFFLLFFPVLVNPIMLLCGTSKHFMKPIKPQDQHKIPITLSITQFSSINLCGTLTISQKTLRSS